MDERKSKIELVIFDLGKVILDFDHMITCNKLAKYSKKDALYIYNFIFKSELLENYEKGKISSMEMFSAVSDELEIDIPFIQFKEIWSDIFSLNDGIEQLIKRVRLHSKIAILSNTDEMHFEHIRDNVEIIKDFDWIFLSYEIGFRKPEKEIFVYAINKTGIAPEKIIFIDDIQEFVNEANKLGINGILYTDIDNLKINLEKFLKIKILL
jgi:glucose-1-phosphatase